MSDRGIRAYFDTDLDAHRMLLESDDMPNALELWALNAAAIYDHTVRSNPHLDLSRASVVSAFMPKSGGTFIHNRLLRDFGYVEYFWGIGRRHAQADVYPVREALDLFLKGGCACHSHAIPSHVFRRVMAEAGVERFWVHVRHPAEACLSAFYHYQGYGQGRGAVAAKRAALNREEAAAIAATAAVDVTTIERCFATSFDFFVDWIELWLRFDEMAPGRVVFTRHQDLADADAFFGNVSRRLGLGPAPRRISRDHEADRRRVGGVADWRAGVSPDLRREIERRIATRLGRYDRCRDLIGAGADGDRLRRGGVA